MTVNRIKILTLQKFQINPQNGFDQNLQMDFNAKIDENPNFQIIDTFVNPFFANCNEYTKSDSLTNI